jgi:integration host factor subunit beta
MNKSDLIEQLAIKHDLQKKDSSMAVNLLLNEMAKYLASGERIEIRSFGSWNLHYRKSRIARNPMTGGKVSVPDKYAVHFKPGKLIRDRVNASKAKNIL